ncbi:MAG: hypothetical protein QXI31_00025 [Archaeoglobaceae archaeon]
MKMKNRQVFKFSVDETSDNDIIYYLKSIKNKNTRGLWILNAIRLLKDLETNLRTTEFSQIKDVVEECIKNQKSKSRF